VKNTPKPLLDIAGKTLIDHLVDKIKASDDLKEIIVVTNDKFYGMFSLWAKQNSESRVPIKIINDGTTSPEDRLGSVGDIKFVLENYPVRRFVFWRRQTFDYFSRRLHGFAKKTGRHLGLTTLNSLKDAPLGVVEIDREGVVKTFQENQSSLARR
jgi:glucose-1-phosphate thymidylyltransferase